MLLADQPGCRWSREAADGGRTRDLKLGKLALYQLSYRRAARILRPQTPRHDPLAPGLLVSDIHDGEIGEMRAFSTRQEALNATAGGPESGSPL